MNNAIDCPADRSVIGMADGRPHDRNADERMRPTAQIDAAVSTRRMFFFPQMVDQ